MLHNRDGSPVPAAPHYVLPTDRVRHVGTAVAFVIAETIAAAKDAAEKVVVDYEPLPVVTEGSASAESDAPRLYDDLPNVMIDAEVGDAEATAEAFKRAAHVTRLDTWVNRVTGVPMEPRAAVGIYDAASGRYTLYAGSGGIVRQKKELSQIFGVPFDSVRVVAHEIGGNFGTRNSFFPEFALVVWGAKRLGRPVKWTCERTEAFVTDYMGRDLTVSAELALDAGGHFLALRTSNLSNIGAHTGSYVPLVKGVGLATAGYRIPIAHIRARAVLSNTMCTTPYRSAGRPEVIYVIERLIDKAAQEHGFDRVALRRRNLIPPSAFPYKNPQGITYDNGTYRAVMDRAMELGDWKGFKKRRAEARKRKRLRGIGLCCYLETTGGYPRERADITVQPQGRVDVVVGTLSSGQSSRNHVRPMRGGMARRAVRRRVRQRKRHRHRQGRRRLPFGPLDAACRHRHGQRLRRDHREGQEDRRPHAGNRRGRYRLRGRALHRQRHRPLGRHFRRGQGGGRRQQQSRARGFARTARRHRRRNHQAARLSLWRPCVRGRDRSADRRARSRALHGGRRCRPRHQPDGRATARPTAAPRKASARRCGSAAPTMREGQLLSASFMDYAMPRADILPSFTTDISEVLTPTNRLGVRGAGEGGTTGALGAVVNAVVDALAEFGVTHIEMPVTPERIWRAIQSAKT